MRDDVDEFGKCRIGRRRPMSGLLDEVDELDLGAESRLGDDRRGVNDAARDGKVISDEDELGCCQGT
jgi:hypothetical protein